MTKTVRKMRKNCQISCKFFWLWTAVAQPLKRISKLNSLIGRWETIPRSSVQLLSLYSQYFLLQLCKKFFGRVKFIAREICTILKPRARCTGFHVRTRSPFRGSDEWLSPLFWLYKCILESSVKHKAPNIKYTQWHCKVNKVRLLLLSRECIFCYNSRVGQWSLRSLCYCTNRPPFANCQYLKLTMKWEQLKLG